MSHQCKINQKKCTSTQNIQKVIIFHKNLQKIDLSNSKSHQKINQLSKKRVEERVKFCCCFKLRPG